MSLKVENLTETQCNDLLAAEQFRLIRSWIVDHLFLSGTTLSLDIDPTVEYRCGSHLILKELRQLLPFGRTLDNAQVATVAINHPSRLLKACEAQLLFWHLRRNPHWMTKQLVSSLTIVKEEDHFWFHYISHICQLLQSHLLSGWPIQFLERFVLNHQHVQLEFEEL